MGFNALTHTHSLSYTFSFFPILYINSSLLLRYTVLKGKGKKEGRKKEGYKKGVCIFGIENFFLRHYILPMLYIMVKL